MDEIEFIGAMGHQQLLAQQRAENLEKMLAAAEQRGYEKALDDLIAKFRNMHNTEGGYEFIVDLLLDVKSAHGGQE